MLFVALIVTGSLAEPPVPYPHPLITEVLFAVPSGQGGDANLDGIRDASGDEFVELMNPHDRPIDLGGYVLTDRNAIGKGQLAFRFPAVKVPPGCVVVVFNGCNQRFDGPVGDTETAPSATDPRFHNATVFTLRNDSTAVGFANGGDYILLTAPDGTQVHCIRWGTFEEPLPEAGLVEEAPKATGRSVTRRGPDGPFEPHPRELGLFSPGRFPPDAASRSPG